jgi:hypothetical protein
VVATTPTLAPAVSLEPRSAIGNSPSRSASDTISPIVTTAAVLLFLIGVAWDVQWHRSIGRDRLFTPPHVVMLVGIALVGLASLAALLHEAWHLGHGKPLVSLLEAGRSRLGVALSGFGAALAAIAFVLDDYWHTLHGIDVTLWAPFHVMIVTGVGIAGVGAVSQFAGALQSGMTGRGRAVSEIGCAVSLSVALGTYLVLIAEAMGRQSLAELGDVRFALYPVLLGLALPVAPVCAALVTRRSGGAVLVALLFVAIRQVLFAFVPWATATLASIEGLSFRANPAPVTITPFAYPELSLLLVAATVELALWWGRRRGIDPTWPVVLIAAAAALPASFVDRPWEVLLPRFNPGTDLSAIGVAASPWCTVSVILASVAGRALASTLAPREGDDVRPPGVAGQRAGWCGTMLLILASVLVGGANSAEAHENQPEAVTPARIGPYVLEVRSYAEPVGGRELPFEIVPSGTSLAPTLFYVLAVPGPATNAVPVRARTLPAPDHAGIVGRVNLPVTGQWLLNIDVDGPSGPPAARQRWWRLLLRWRCPTGWPG